MELLLGWYETQVQEVLTTYSTSDGTDYYEVWEPKTIVTSPFGYKRTRDFKSVFDADSWCIANSSDSSHYFVWDILNSEWDEIERLYPDLNKWYYK